MMLVDCQTCPVRDVHCADCMVTALTIPLRAGPPSPRAGGDHQALPEARLGGPGVVAPRPVADAVETAPLDRAERRAVSAFVAAGLVSAATANAARATLDADDRMGQHRARRAV